MILKPALEEFDILIRKVKLLSDKNNYAVFEANVIEWRPIKKEWSLTKQKITCTGYFYSVIENDRYHVRAEEIEHPVYGTQWQIYAAERIEPGTHAEMTKFLTSVKGIGPEIAKKLIDAFGLNVISTILSDPNSLDRLGLRKDARDGLYRAIIDNQAYEQLLIFLQLHDLSPRHATEIYKMYGAESVDKICDNPYSLYMDEVIDFPAAVKLDLNLGFGTPKAFFTQAAVLACLREDSEQNGNLFMDAADLPHRLERYIQKICRGQDLSVPGKQDIDDALLQLFSGRYLIVDSSLKTGQPIYLTANYWAEMNISDQLHNLLTSVKDLCAGVPAIRDAIDKYITAKSVPLSGEQQLAIQTALFSPVSILTGGPGTGKTQTLTTLVNVAKALWPNADIRVCAPTGKAAMRAQELTGVSAYTIHRAIGYPSRMLKEDELRCGLLIADEFSMCDAQLCSWLLKALSSGARLLIVGDHEQLPSVGPGLVLRDMIDCGMIPVTRLTTIFRQSGKSNIVLNAHKIIRTPSGQDIDFEWSHAPGGDFYFVPASGQRRIQSQIIKCTHRLLSMGYGINQIAVLSPIHGGLVGTDTLNCVLQEALNPIPAGSARTSYQINDGGELRIGDKVIQTSNNYDINVFNGETGTVKQIHHSAEKTILVEFPNRDVWYNYEEVDDLDLAYTITTHRSQGSEFQAVIIPVCAPLVFSSNKNLLYTAITRAKKIVVFVGSEEALRSSLKKSSITERNSNLLLRIQTKLLA